MAYSTSNNREEQDFWKNVHTTIEETVQDFSITLNIVVIGKVSAGKSSLINALLKRNRKNAIAQVGAEAGITRKLKILRLDQQVRLIDSPGLDDVRDENSQITQDFLKHIDVGILVLTGAADASQKKYLDDLKIHCDSVFVVLNKIDEWDKLEQSALEKVMKQWKEKLRIEKIYPVCAIGYDPDTKIGTALDVRGVYWLRKDLETFLASKGKDLLLARHMGEKKTYATKIITSASIAVAVQAFLPGSGAFMAATLATSIISLYYLYTGKVLSSKAAFAILPTFAAEAARTTIFLWVQSFLPPTGAIDIAAALIAVITTIAILATINSILANGEKLEEEELLKSKFRAYRQEVEIALKNVAFTDIKNPSTLTEIIEKVTQ